MAKIAFAPANLAEASVEPTATLSLERRSFLHTVHSARKIASGEALPVSNSWHAVWLHSSVCPFQLPGTGVARPCKNAWFVSDNVPFRTSFCRLCNQTSCVRSHSSYRYIYIYTYISADPGLCLGRGQRLGLQCSKGSAAARAAPQERGVGGTRALAHSIT